MPTRRKSSKPRKPRKTAKKPRRPIPGPDVYCDGKPVTNLLTIFERLAAKK